MNSSVVQHGKKQMVSFIVPVLNEELNIRDTVDTIRKNVSASALEYEIIIVDGGSSDRTVEIANSLAVADKKIRVCSNMEIKGFGHAFKTGATLSKGDYVLMIPGDNEIPGETISLLLKKAGEADMIIPYFVNQELRKVSRKIISGLFVRLLNVISGLKLQYYNGTVLYRSSVIKGYNIRTAGFAYQAEALINLLKRGFTYREVAAGIQKRSGGKTKIFGLKNVISVLGFLIALLWRERISHIFRRRTYIGKLSVFKKIRADKELPATVVPEEINYVAVFLTFGCNLHCSYCINNYEEQILKKGIMDGESWVRGLNRLKLRHNLPVTLQGGEPTLHPDFYYIIENLRQDIEIDILTNLQFDTDEFISKIKPQRLNRDSRFHSIRASYHPEEMNISETVAKVLKLQKAGFNICLSAVGHPSYKELLDEAAAKASDAGITFFIKEYLGFYNGEMFGEYKYPDAVTCGKKKNVLCRSTELLIGTLGEIQKCTREVYMNSKPAGYLLDPGFKVGYKYRSCDMFGYCNPCDVKVKTDRFLNKGHTSVDIKFNNSGD